MVVILKLVKYKSLKLLLSQAKYIFLNFRMKNRLFLISTVKYDKVITGLDSFKINKTWSLYFKTDTLFEKDCNWVKAGVFAHRQSVICLYVSHFSMQLWNTVKFECQ